MKLQKTRKWLGILLIALLCTGCSVDPRELDGKYVQDSGGRVMKVEAGVGEIYFLQEVDAGDLDKIRGK